MSILCPIDTFEQSRLDTIEKELVIKLVDKFGNGPTKHVYPFALSQDKTILHLPFSYATKNLNVRRKNRSDFPSVNVTFEGSLRPEQKEIRKEIISNLNKCGSTIVSAYTGFGKTVTACNIACALRFKTLIIVNKIILISQWEQSIKNLCPDATISILKPKKPIFDSDFYIVNATNVEKIDIDMLNNIGFVIVDEAHLIMAEQLSKSLLYVSPRYLLALTATPYRPDGLNKLLEFYFGTHKIIRKMVRDHIVFKINTNITPPIERTITGRLDWNAILNYQAESTKRNEMIVKIIQGLPSRYFLVLVKRVMQGNILVNMLSEVGISTTSLLGKSQTYDPEAKVLIGTNSKVGTGFDHPKLNTLILAADVEEYYVQYMGRIFRTKEGTPIIFDMVDNNPTLEKHFKTRYEAYKDAGGRLTKIKLGSPQEVEKWVSDMIL